MDKNEVVTEDQQVIDCLWPEQLNRIECNLSRACNAIAVNLSKRVTRCDLINPINIVLLLLWATVNVNKMQWKRAATKVWVESSSSPSPAEYICNIVTGVN